MIFVAVGNTEIIIFACVQPWRSCNFKILYTSNFSLEYTLIIVCMCGVYVCLYVCMYLCIYCKYVLHMFYIIYCIHQLLAFASLRGFGTCYANLNSLLPFLFHKFLPILKKNFKTF